MIVDTKFGFIYDDNGRAKFKAARRTLTPLHLASYNWLDPIALDLDDAWDALGHLIAYPTPDTGCQGVTITDMVTGDTRTVDGLPGYHVPLCLTEEFLFMASDDGEVSAHRLGTDTTLGGFGVRDPEGVSLWRTGDSNRVYLKLYNEELLIAEIGDENRIEVRHFQNAEDIDTEKVHFGF